MLVSETIDPYVTQLDPSSFDAVADFAALFPVEIITSMLGVPPADRQQLRLWLDKGLERDEGIGIVSREYGRDDEIRRLLRSDSAAPRGTAGRHDQRAHRGGIVEDGETRRLDDIAEKTATRFRRPSRSYCATRGRRSINPHHYKRVTMHGKTSRGKDGDSRNPTADTK